MSELSELDDTDDDWEEGEEDVTAAPVSMVALPTRQMEIRRRIEEILEAKRLREEFGDF
ncbi:MAG: hypothetical protein O2780_13865 [Proteobacteria bacterium]|nr:hypothetical protein [Pseudomonadota bacterium]MDA1302626.1 hypothetical protein [Pseudomonadota bacterium]